MKSSFKGWIPVAAWCSLIFYLSGVPDLKTEIGGIIDLVLRKGAHITEYCVLYLLARKAFAGTLAGRGAASHRFAAALFSVLYAASDEFHQSFVPTRGPSIFDVGIDSAGVAAGYLIDRLAGSLQRAEK
jgi:VanZ family protein